MGSRPRKGISKFFYDLDVNYLCPTDTKVRRAGLWFFGQAMDGVSTEIEETILLHRIWLKSLHRETDLTEILRQQEIIP